ncbi:MAG: hypothetical protein QMD73_09980 [Rhodocyclaceae bacterium]|nr:hypothetical protein [Rhodocyclaceae bacterium]
MPKLKLKVTHTHAGVVYPVGHVIDVDEHTARWLTDHQIGELASHRPEPASDAHDATAKSVKTHKE